MRVIREVFREILLTPTVEGQILLIQAGGLSKDYLVLFAI